jgi:amino-acid N-acetyltransferase
MLIKPIEDLQSLKIGIALLKESGLPAQDVELGKTYLIGCYDETGKLIGTGGLEFYNSMALMRSIAVDSNHKGNAIGKEIVNSLINIAKSKSVSGIYLLTETARTYFLRIGFKDIEREKVPTEIKKSTEFDSVCPVSAVCMVYKV